MIDIPLTIALWLSIISAILSIASITTTIIILFKYRNVENTANIMITLEHDNSSAISAINKLWDKQYKEYLEVVIPRMGNNIDYIMSRLKSDSKIEG